MDFAKSHMEKHGWTEGSGLGMSEDGMKEAIKVKMKFDNSGVGHNAGDEFTFHWWDHMFNKALDNIDVENSKEGVQVKNSGDFSITSKKPFNKNFANKELLYGNFVKSSTTLAKSESGLMEEVKEKKDESESESSSDEDDAVPGISFNNLTDDDLMRICGGRTAHKAARHGLKLNGKLKRIEEQEAVLSRGNSDNDSSDSQTSKKKKSKKKKHKKEKDENVPVDVPVEMNSNDGLSNEQEKTKKKKKSKKNKADKDSSIVIEDDESNEQTKKSKKRKRSKKDSPTDRESDNDHQEKVPKISEEITENDSLETAATAMNSDDEVVTNDISVKVKRKKSKKSKKSKKAMS